MIREVAAWRLPTGLSDRYKDWSFGGGDPPAGSFAYNNYDEYRAHVAWYVRETSDLVLRLQTLGHGNWAAQEASEAEKAIVCWRDIGLGALQGESQFEVRNARQANEMAPWIRRSRDEYASLMRKLPSSQLLEAYYGAGIPVNRGKGWPFMMGDDVDGALALLAVTRRADTVADIDHALAECAPILFDRSAVAIMRVQGARKPVTAWGLYGDGLRRTGERVGPKVRKISMCPFPYNARLFGIQGLWLHLSKYITEIGDPLRRAMDIYYKYHNNAVLFAGDLSTYDDTIAIETREMIAQEFLIPLFAEKAVTLLGLPKRDMDLAIEVFNTYSTMPILMPPSAKNHGARLVPSAGRFQSGEAWTGRLGGLFNRDRNRRRIHMLGGGGRFSVQGDDQFNMMPAGFDIARWVEEELGLIEVVSLILAMLMRNPAGGYGSITRMLSLQKEPRFEPEDTLLAAVAMASRYDVLLARGVKHHQAKPHPLHELYWPALGRHPKARVRQAALLARTMSPTQRQTVLDQRVSQKTDRFREGLKDWAVDDEKGSFRPTESNEDIWDTDGVKRVPFAIIEHGKLPDVKDAQKIIREQSYTTRRKPL